MNLQLKDIQQCKGKQIFIRRASGMRTLYGTWKEVPGFITNDSIVEKEYTDN